MWGLSYEVQTLINTFKALLTSKEKVIRTQYDDLAEQDMNITMHMSDIRVVDYNSYVILS